MSDKIDIIIPTCKRMREVQPVMKEIELFTPEPHRLIVTCQRVSAAKNRNYGLTVAESNTLVMLDDDMTGFFEGWLTKILEPIARDSNVCMVSARLMNQDGTIGPTSADNFDIETKWVYVQRKVMPSAAIAFIDLGLRFDEKYIGSGYEDTDMCFQYHRENPKYEFVINNECKLIHLHESKNQGEAGEPTNPNRQYFLQKWGGKMSPV
jgi:hypothetical protein